jgi:hypothetical protein
MAAIPSSSSDATYGCTDSDIESSTTNYGNAADEAVHYKFRDGVLGWESFQLKDEDIITVTRVGGSSVTYNIFSLAPAEAVETTAELEPKQAPFQLRTTVATKLPPEFLDRHLFQGLLPQLNPSNDIHTLISTISGTGLAPEFFEKILQPLLRAIGLTDSKYHVVRTESAESVKEFARSVLLVGANIGRRQTVLMLSGDGGVVDTINGLLVSGTRSRHVTLYTPYTHH